MLLIVWEYMVRPDRVEEFEALYRPDGEWVDLLKKSPGFVSTTLMRDVRDPLRYIISDRWNSETSYDSLIRDFADEYAALNARGERTHRAEHLIGRFHFVE
jgi:heme-degrading monooxygenase HmoA